MNLSGHGTCYQVLFRCFRGKRFLSRINKYHSLSIAVIEPAFPGPPSCHDFLSEIYNRRLFASANGVIYVLLLSRCTSTLEVLVLSFSSFCFGIVGLWCLRAGEPFDRTSRRFTLEYTRSYTISQPQCTQLCGDDCGGRRERHPWKLHQPERARRNPRCELQFARCAGRIGDGRREHHLLCEGVWGGTACVSKNDHAGCRWNT